MIKTTNALRVPPAISELQWASDAASNQQASAGTTPPQFAPQRASNARQTPTAAALDGLGQPARDTMSRITTPAMTAESTNTICQLQSTLAA